MSSATTFCARRCTCRASSCERCSHGFRTSPRGIGHTLRLDSSMLPRLESQPRRIELLNDPAVARQSPGCRFEHAGCRPVSRQALDQSGPFPILAVWVAEAAPPSCSRALCLRVVFSRQPAAPTRAAFADVIERLSEPPGTFDTDNLISNERSYLDVIPAIVARPVQGGAYVGVGPDQNFSYIARIRPSVAYLVDIRRENLLLHLLFKALFAEAHAGGVSVPADGLRRFPVGTERWKSATIGELVAHIDESARWPEDMDALRQHVETRLAAFGVPLSLDDLETIRRFHRVFVTEGLDLVYSGQRAAERRPYPASDYPNLRELLTARAADGKQWNYLASEDDFVFLKEMQARDAIIPVVGDVSGPRALKSIAASIADRGERVSAFYISNVETYLEQKMVMGQFLDNLSRLPHGSERCHDSVDVRRRIQHLDPEADRSDPHGRIRNRR